MSTKSQSISAPAVHLNPFETKRLDITALLAAAGIRKPEGTIHFSFRYTGPPNTLIAATGSVDQTGSYVFDVQARGIEPTASRTITYMGNTDGSDTMFTLWNPVADAQDVIVTFFTQAGTYKLPLHIDPRGTRMFNLSEIAMENLPDADGHMLPMNPTGTAEIASSKGRRNKFTLAIDAGKFNVQTGTCGEGCVCSLYITIVDIEPNVWEVLYDTGMQMSSTITYNDNRTENGTNYGSWSTDNESVATVTSTAYLWGAGPGSANLLQIFFQEGPPAEGCQMYDTCYASDAEGMASGFVDACTPGSVVNAPDVNAQCVGNTESATAIASVNSNNTISVVDVSVTKDNTIFDIGSPSFDGCCYTGGNRQATVHFQTTNPGNIYWHFTLSCSAGTQIANGTQHVKCPPP